jgi:hypothetical protein
LFYQQWAQSSKTENRSNIQGKAKNDELLKDIANLPFQFVVTPGNILLTITIRKLNNKKKYNKNFRY